MLATTIGALNIPPLWYPLERHIQATAETPKPTYLERIGKGFRYMLGNSCTITTQIIEQPKIEQLGWSAVEAMETHMRLLTFAEDWDAPGMEAYDDV